MTDRDDVYGVYDCQYCVVCNGREERVMGMEMCSPCITEYEQSGRGNMPIDIAWPIPWSEWNRKAKLKGKW